MTSLEDKENAPGNVIVIDDTPAERQEDVHSFFSPPRKKVKQESNGLCPVTPVNDEKPGKKCEKRKSPAQVNKPCVKKDNSPKPPSLNSSPKTPLVTPTRVTKTQNTSRCSKTEQGTQLPFHKVTKEEALKESEKVIESLKTKSKEVSPTCSPLPFQKVSKEDALKESEKEIELLNAKTKETIGVSSDSTSNENEETGSQLKNLSTPGKKASPLSKEERQRLKEEKEQQKAARLKEAEEKKRKREEEKVFKQAEKEKREQEKKDKERIREEEKRKKEEQKEEEKVKKEEERRKKEEEKKAKEEERQKKEEQARIEKEKRDAEKEKKEQDRKMKEEAKKLEDEKKKQDEDNLRKKKEKEANHFRSFFTKKKEQTETTKSPAVEIYQRFQPFQVKQDMTLAPVTRKSAVNRNVLDDVMLNEVTDLTTYLDEQSKRLAETGRLKYITRRQKRRELEEELAAKRKEAMQKDRANGLKVPHSEVDHENIVVINDDSNDVDDGEETEEEEADISVCDNKSCLYVAKLLQFSENTRPAYYGTWRKKSTHVSGRKPFGTDNEIFNYDIDSDEEWIDEPGENLSDDDGDDKEEDELKETDQDGFFVPHGYLSDDEGIDQEQEGSDVDEESSERVPTSGSGDINEDRKLKLKACTLEKDFERRLKQRKPICIGVSYTRPDDNLNPVLKTFLKVALVKPDKPSEDGDNNDDEDCADMETSPKSKEEKSPQVLGMWQNGINHPLTVPEEAMPFLIRFIHGNTSGLEKMNTTFREFWAKYVEQNVCVNGSGSNATENKMTNTNSNTDTPSRLRAAISKRQLERKIQTIASRNYNSNLGKMCYTVNEDTVKTYNITDLRLGQGLPPLEDGTPSLQEERTVVEEVLEEQGKKEDVAEEKEDRMEMN